jgi:hypothetical protein
MASIKLDHGVPLFIGAQMAGCYPRKRHQCDMWECPLGPIAAIGQQKYDRKFDPPFGHRAIKSKIRRAVWSDGIHIRHEQQILHKTPGHGYVQCWLLDEMRTQGHALRPR